MKFAIVILLSIFVVGCANPTVNPVRDNFAGWSCWPKNSEAKQEDTWKIEGDVLKCSGVPSGYLYTKESYTDFVMTLQWRWPDAKNPGKGGVLFDITGKHKTWPKSLEAQINANGAGDFWALDGYGIKGPPDRTKSFDNKQFGRLTNIRKIEAAEKPAGQWNSYKIIADGPTVTLIINGRVVNRCTRTDLTGGKICVTSEGTPIHYRNIEITRTK